VIRIQYVAKQGKNELVAMPEAEIAGFKRRLIQSGLKAEIHHDGGVDFDGFSVEERGGVAPLADGFDGRAREFGIDLAVYHAEGERLSVHANNGVEDDGAADARRLGGIGIDRRDVFVSREFF
jgi:hypothetical protein